MGASTRVLVIEDEPSVASGLVRGLRAQGFEVRLASDGDAGLRAALQGQIDIILLDLMLPQRSGFEVLAGLKDRGAAPVLVLTARTDLDDRLKAFDLGAVDFVAKPFFLEEIVARIRSRLRLREAAPRRRVAWADALVDLDARTVQVAEHEVSLTKHEFDVLAYLLERRGRAVSRAALAEHALDPLSEREPRTVDSHVARLRRKLGPAGEALVTVWGIGYRFVAAGDSE